MDELVFSISLKDHTFNIRTTPRSTLCYYYNEGKYTTSLIFASNTYASVKYKNVDFSGTVTKRNIWSVDLDFRPIFKKYYDSYYFLSNEPVQSTESSKVISNVTTAVPDKILWLYDQLIVFLHQYYRCIEDKETFKDQICKLLSESYLNDDIEDLDKIVEYENWDDVSPNEEPIIEKRSIKDILIKECQDYFVCFRQAEIDSKNKKAIITLENIIKEAPSLSYLPLELLQREFSKFLDKNYVDLIKPDIWYYQEEVLLNIGEEIYNSCQYVLFVAAVEEKIDTILSAMVVEDIDKDELYAYFKSHYDKDCLPSDEEFELDVRKFVNEQISFHSIYKKYVSLFNTDHIKIEWDDEKLGLFQKYDKEEQWVDPQNLAEYEVYKYVIPFYRKHFFRKNSNQYRPVVEQLPGFTSYGTSVLDILFKYKVIINNGDRVVYNYDGNFDMALKEINVLESNR